MTDHNTWTMDDELAFVDELGAGKICCNVDNIRNVPKPVITRIKNLEGYIRAVGTYTVANFTDEQDMELMKRALGHIKRLGG